MSPPENMGSELSPHTVLDGYIRVSKVAGREGESYISPSVQREAIERWADYKKVEIAEWHIDEDWSGGTQARPGLEAAVARSVGGTTHGIVSWKIDRFSRYTEGGLRDLRRLEKAGARLAFVSEDIDTSGPLGRFVYTIMLAMGEYFLDTTKAGWATAQERAIKRGAKVGGIPYGYRQGPSGVLELHPDEAPHMRKAFEITAAQGVSAATRYLAANAPGRKWTTATTRYRLGRRTYLGEISHGNFINPEAHEPLVSIAIWEAAQHEPRIQVRNPTGTYPLSGLARCGSCEAPMIGGPKGSNGQRLYQCSAIQTQYKGPRCPRAAYIVAARLENHVREQLRPILAGASVRSIDGGDEAVLAKRALAEAEAELEAFAADLTMRRALGERYHEHLQSRVEARERARDIYRALSARSEALEHLLSSADILDGEDQALFGNLLRRMLVSIVVQPGRGGNLNDRVSIVFPDDL